MNPPRGPQGLPPFVDSDLPVRHTGRAGRAAVKRESWFAGLGAGADSTRPQEDEEQPPPDPANRPRRRMTWSGRPAVDKSVPLPDTVPADLFQAPQAPSGEPEPPAAATRPPRAAPQTEPPLDSQSDEASLRAGSGVDAPPPKAFQRIFRGFVVARALLGVLLLAMQGVITVYASVGPSLSGLAVCAAYSLSSLWLVAQVEMHWPPRLGPALGPGGQLRRRWVLVTVGVDLLCFSLLLAATAQGPLNISALLLLPVLTAGALMPRRAGLAVAAGVVLVMLGGAWWRVLAGAEMAAQLTQAGMSGAVVFAMALLTTEMAERLARQEVTARSTLELARQQALLNRLMIEEMQDGVMVVDRAGHVRAANPAAMALIGAPQGRRFSAFDLQEHEAWLPLWTALERGYASGVWPEGGEEISLQLNQGQHTEERGLRLRMRFTRRRDARSGEALCVLFLEDLRILRARARQEKLAAMGRVSAGIAHEIRNPLAAISQANALLAEDLTVPAQRQLARMVSDNVERLQRIVDDVMEVAPGAPRDAPAIDLPLQVQTLCAEWGRTAGLPQAGQSPLLVDIGEGGMAVKFDPDHLRRVLVNLLENALRHGSGRPDALWVRVQARGTDEVVLSVASDGAPIAADVEPYLFEPFFSTRSRGSGLGLYICRELCERYGATIEYRPRGPGVRHRNVFVLTLPRRVAVQMSARQQKPS